MTAPDSPDVPLSRQRLYVNIDHVATLRQARRTTEPDPVLAAAECDAAGDGVAKYFAGIKREEFFSYHGTVTPWEVDQYLTAF